MKRKFKRSLGKVALVNKQLHYKQGPYYEKWKAAMKVYGARL